MRSQIIDFANVQADVLVIAQRAINRYIFQNYIVLQNDGAVTANMVTLSHGTSDGQSRRPTVANLRAMGYLPSTFADTAVLNAGTYRFEITKGPAGCVGAACAIDGLVWIDAPIRVRGTTEPDGVTVATMQMRIGGNSAASDLTNPAVLLGTGGGFNVPNPVVGNPAGVVGIRVGFNAEVEAAYVRIGDNRDPNLAGPLTVAGRTTINNQLVVSGGASITGTLTVSSTINAGGTITGVGQVGVTDAIGSCVRSSLESDGRVVVRRSDCATAGVMDSTGALQLNDAANVARVRADAASGTLAIKGSTGLTQVQLDSSSGQVSAWNAAGTAATVMMNGTEGRLTSQRNQLTASATAGSSCAGALEGDLVLDADVNSGTVICRGGIWRRGGLQAAVANNACPQTGALGQDTTGVAYICRAGLWASLTDRVSRSILMARYLVTEGTSVPHPACSSGAVPTILMTPVDQTGAPTRNRFAAFAEGAVGSWTARIRLYDSSGTGYTTSFAGSSYGLRAIAQTSCDFPN